MRVMIVAVMVMLLSACSCFDQARQDLFGSDYEFTDPYDMPWATDVAKRHCKIQPCANYSDYSD